MNPLPILFFSNIEQATNSLYKYQLNRMVTMIRGSLITAVYSKTTRLDGSSCDSAALSLMSTDTVTICTNLNRLDGMLAAPIEVALGVLLLERQVGVACIAPVIIVLCSAMLATRVAAKGASKQRTWNQAVQERVSFTASVLNSPKGFKMLGLSEKLATILQALRVKELGKSKGARTFTMWRNIVGMFCKLCKQLNLY